MSPGPRAGGRILRCGEGRGARAGTRDVMTPPLLAILGFHKIGEPPAGRHRTWFYVPEATFATQLAQLDDEDWTVLDLDAFLRGLTAPETLPPRAALLTFDDGYQSLLEVALPWLRRFNYPAVAFVPTAFVGGVSSFEA